MRCRCSKRSTGMVRHRLNGGRRHDSACESAHLEPHTYFGRSSCDAGAGCFGIWAASQCEHRAGTQAELRNCDGAWPNNVGEAPTMSDLRYDGQTLRWNRYGTFRATSVLEGLQDPKYQCVSDGGPIPEGTYRLQLAVDRNNAQMTRLEAVPCDRLGRCNTSRAVRKPKSASRTGRTGLPACSTRGCRFAHATTHASSVRWLSIRLLSPRRVEQLSTRSRRPRYCPAGS